MGPLTVVRSVFGKGKGRSSRESSSVCPTPASISWSTLVDHWPLILRHGSGHTVDLAPWASPRLRGTLDESIELHSRHAARRTRCRRSFLSSRRVRARPRARGRLPSTSSTSGHLCSESQRSLPLAAPSTAALLHLPGRLYFTRRLNQQLTVFSYLRVAKTSHSPITR